MLLELLLFRGLGSWIEVSRIEVARFHAPLMRYRGETLSEAIAYSALFYAICVHLPGSIICAPAKGAALIGGMW